jgi:hypothetical protein
MDQRTAAIESRRLELQPLLGSEPGRDHLLTILRQHKGWGPGMYPMMGTPIVQAILNCEFPPEPVQA